MTSSLTDARSGVVTDPVGAWFGAVVHRTGTDTCAVTIPEPAAGTGGSVLARLIQGVDIAAGVAACLAVAPGSALTADIVLHVLDDGVGDLAACGSIIRAGRGQVVANVDVVDARGALVACATVNHGIRAQELRMYLHDLEPGDAFDLAPYRTAPSGPLSEVFHDAAGEIPVNAATTNPWGIAQGALITTLVEPAAATAGLAGIEDLSVRFLASATVGPVAFVPTSAHDRGPGRLLRGSLHDRGADRTVALISATGPRSQGDPR